MRELLCLLTVTHLLCAITSTARAGTFVPAYSFMKVKLSDLPASMFYFYAEPFTEGRVSLVDNGVGAMTS
jgi:hypothetical protein